MSIQDLIRDEVYKCIARARITFPSFASCPMPSISFYSKGRTAGMAIGSKMLRFNDYILAQDAAMMVNTVSHEVAHAVCHYTGLGKGHNPGWKRVHRALGGTAERCFSGEGLDVPLARVQRKYEHRATCGTIINLSCAMHNSIMRSGKSRILRATRGQLNRMTFTGKII